MASACCPPGALPYLEEEETYKPKGQIHLLPPCERRSHPCRLYIAGVDNAEDTAAWTGKRILVVIHDVFGPNSGRHRLVCDMMAERLNAVVILPDCYRGQGLVPGYEVEQSPAPLGFNMWTFKALSQILFRGVKSFFLQFPYENDLEYMLADQLVPFLQSKSQEGIEKVPFGMMGICFGSWVVFKACCDSKLTPHLKCGIHFHASVHIERRVHGRDDLKLCSEVTCPQFFVCTPQEKKDWHAGGKAEELLKSNTNMSEVVFIETKEMHGFLVRGDRHNPKTKKEIESTLMAACDFFDKHYPGQTS